jgi:hypothetical protein
VRSNYETGISRVNIEQKFRLHTIVVSECSLEYWVVILDVLQLNNPPLVAAEARKVPLVRLVDNVLRCSVLCDAYSTDEQQEQGHFGLDS